MEMTYERAVQDPEEQLRRSLLAQEFGDGGMSSMMMCERVGCTYRQLDYWQRIDLVRPSLREAHGSGTRRRWAEKDVPVVRVAKLAMDQLIFSERAREVVEIVRSQVNDGEVLTGWIVIGNRDLMYAARLIDLAEAVQTVGPMVTVIDLAPLDDE